MSDNLNGNDDGNTSLFEAERSCSHYTREEFKEMTSPMDMPKGFSVMHGLKLDLSFL